jgi:hypothetical protein
LTEKQQAQGFSRSIQTTPGYYKIGASAKKNANLEAKSTNTTKNVVALSAQYNST